MKAHVVRFGTAALMAGALARPAAAQLGGDPVYFSPQAPPGPRLGPRLGVSADKETQFMGSAALKFFSPPLVPVGISLQAGAGYLKQGSGAGAVKTISVPIGVGVAIKPPTPGLAVEVWGATRM